MLCPLCQQRKPRRDCPALHQKICAVCCGTKRLVEIDCPADCVHLTATRQHPAAVVRRQQEHDVATMMPSVRHLTERQQQLFFLFHTVIARHVPDGLARLVDEDVAEAAASVASTIETAARGVIYEHAAQSLPAQKLANEMKALLVELRKSGATIYDGEVAITLRAIDAGAREARQVDGTGADDAYLGLMRRLLRVRPGAQEPPPQKSSLILP